MPRVVGVARSASWLLVLLLAAVPAAAAILEAETVATIEASLKVTEPLVATGDVGTSGLFFAVIRPLATEDAARAVNEYFADEVEYIIHELAWYTVGTPDPGGHDGLPPMRLPTTKLKPSTMEVVDLGKNSVWIAKSITMDGEVRLVDPSACEVTAGTAESVKVGEADERGPWGSVEPMVLHAMCGAPRLLIEGPVALRLEGSTVRVTGQDAAGRPYEEELCTGLCTYATAAPQVYRHTYRYIWVYPAQYTNPRVEFLVPSDVHLQAPVLGVGGELRVPPAQGNIQWADWQAKRDIPALKLYGLFEVTAQDVDEIQMKGATTNRPHVNVMGRETVGPIGRNAGWGLAAAAGACMAASPFHPRIRWLLLGLFSRLSEERAMAHPRRQQIVEAVRVNPGMKVQEVCRMLALSRGVADHHVEVLCRQGVLVCRRFGRETGLFVKGSVDWELQPQVQRLRNETVRALLQHVQNEPDITQTELAVRLNVGQSYVCRVLKQLTQLGVLTPVEDAGRRRAYQLTTSAANTWIPPGTPDGLVTAPTPVAAAPGASAPTFAALQQ